MPTLIMLTKLVLLFILQSSAILIFLRGFLLTRVVIPEYSHPCNITSPCPPQRFQRAIWLLIDALRYDFIHYNSSLTRDVPSYINKMPNMKHFIHDRPQNTKLFRFVADPPTTTMQRLKALTTGSLPTFIDIGSNFNSYQIQEDNLIRQLKKNSRTITFLGDDTWLGMYPNQFDRSYPGPSLNVRDLDTVDNLVIKHILPEIQKNSNDFIIGHFLGVDHCGHTYGPNNYLMALKLTQLDHVIKSVFEAVDNDTIVFVFGDHGMTESGDHGGETSLETGAALLIYSPRPIFDNQLHSGDTVYQTDLVPTVSLLLGLPIPFSNLGMVIPDLFITSRGSGASSLPYPQSVYDGRVSHSLLTALKSNTDQLNNFINIQNQYGNYLPSDQVNSLKEMYQSISSQYWEAINISDTSSLTNIVDSYIKYMRKVRDICLTSWATFDVLSMLVGIAMLVVHLVAVLFIIVTGFSNYSFWSNDFKWIDVVAGGIAILHSLSLFANSFVVYEGQMAIFLSQSLLLALLVNKVLCDFSKVVWVYPPLTRDKRTYLLTTKDNNVMYCCWSSMTELICTSALPFVKIMVCVHLTSYFHTCRDQQIECTLSSLFQRLDINMFGLIRYSVSVLSFIFTMRYISYFLKNFFVYGDCSYKRFIFPERALIIANELKIAVNMTGFTALSYEIIPVWMFRGLVAAVIFVIVYGIKYPFVSNKSSDLSIIASDNDDNVPLVLAPYSWILLSVWIVITFVVVVANDFLFISISVGLIQFVFILQMLKESTEVSLLVKAVICSLYSYQFFFGFGHQATVSSLRVDAAFVGLYGDITLINLPIAATLVVINMLASQVLSSLILPLLLSHHKNKQDNFLPLFYQLQLFYILVGSLKLLCAVVGAMIHRRHLMVWSVFAPRFMYEASFQTVVNLFGIGSFLLIFRYHKIIQLLKVRSCDKEP